MFSKSKNKLSITSLLVGDFNPFEKYSSKWVRLPQVGDSLLKMLESCWSLRFWDVKPSSRELSLYRSHEVRWFQKSAADRLRHASSKPLFFWGGFFVKVELCASPKNSTIGICLAPGYDWGIINKGKEMHLEMKLNLCE